MVAIEALQDPFMHMYTSDTDEDNFKGMDVTNVNKIMIRQFSRDCKSYLCNCMATAEKSNFDTKIDAGQVARKNPGFDPVFMKVWGRKFMQSINEVRSNLELYLFIIWMNIKIYDCCAVQIIKWYELFLHMKDKVATQKSRVWNFDPIDTARCYEL